ncbi:MAG TPA: hypothetical protein VF169_01665 [Albitalea sp.]|uniref:hypothetical protein n=1 Tax=Piscinibacter sp. TaxID=1903157 RepID=UPI002ED2A4C7
MSTTLNSIAIDVVGQYGEAAKHLVQAYRTGTERAVTGLGGRYEKLLESRSLPLVTDSVKAGIIGAEQRLSGLVVDTVGRVSDGAGNAVDRVSSRAIEGMQAFGEKTAWANDLMVVNALRTINLPAAKLSLEIATQINKATRSLSERIAGVPAAPAPKAKSAAKRVRRTARKAA